MAGNSDTRGLLWRLPDVRTPELGKIGPGFGYGIGCGVGLGAGLVGGAGLGVGFPGLQFGAGLGAGCGIGIGFGYGFGRGRAYDERGKHSNFGRLVYKRGESSAGGEIISILDEIISRVKQAFENVDTNNGKRRRR